MRLFLSVTPSQEAIDDLALLTRRLRSVRRVARPELWHVTLAFLGEVSPETAPIVEAVVDQVARASRPGRLRLGGGGRFGASVLWAGVRGEVDALQELAAALRAELREAGIGFDERPYRPHLTIARPPAGADIVQLRADVELLSRYRGPYWQLETLHLVRSHFPAAAGHETVASWQLTGEPETDTGRRDR